MCAMLKEGVQAHGGITEGTFYRDQCWHFYMLGRHLERTDQITRLIDTKFNALRPRAATDAAIDAGEWNALLRAAAGIMRIAANIRMAMCRVRSPGSCC